MADFTLRHHSSGGSTMMETMLKEVKQGDLFQLKPDGPVWVRDEYDRSEKKYCVHKWDDVNHWSMMKGSRKVWID